MGHWAARPGRGADRPLGHFCTSSSRGCAASGGWLSTPPITPVPAGKLGVTPVPATPRPRAPSPLTPPGLVGGAPLRRPHRSPPRRPPPHLSPALVPGWGVSDLGVCTLHSSPTSSTHPFFHPPHTSDHPSLECPEPACPLALVTHEKHPHNGQGPPTCKTNVASQLTYSPELASPLGR